MSNRPTRKPSAAAKVSAARTGSTGSRTIWILVSVVVVVLLAAIIAIAMSGGDDSVVGGGPSPSGGTVVPSGGLNYGTVDVAGTALPQGVAAGTTDPAIGETIPTVSGQQFDGSAITIAPGGKPKVIMLVAHWCPHCQAEVPRIQQWLDDSGMPSDVDLYTVATGTSASRGNYPPGNWLRSKGWSVPTLVDDQEFAAAQAFGLRSYPYFVVVDASGKVVVRTSGEISEDQWDGLLQAARTGTPPATATDGQSSPSS